MARWAAVVRRRRWRGGRLPERGGEGACARAGQRARMNGLVCIRSLLTRTCTGAVLLPHPPLLWAVAASAAAEHPGRPATGPVALAAAGASRSRPARAGRPPTRPRARAPARPPAHPPARPPAPALSPDRPPARPLSATPQRLSESRRYFRPRATGSPPELADTPARLPARLPAGLPACPRSGCAAEPWLRRQLLRGGGGGAGQPDQLTDQRAGASAARAGGRAGRLTGAVAPCPARAAGQCTPVMRAARTDAGLPRAASSAALCDTCEMHREASISHVSHAARRAHVAPAARTVCGPHTRQPARDRARRAWPAAPSHRAELRM